MEEGQFHHALKVMEDLCTACSHCMRTCPTEAIRIRGGKAMISDNKCVDCGQCYKVCPSNAIYVEQDDFNIIYNYKYRIAIVPAILIGQFPENINTEEIYSTLIDLGFTHVYEVENSVDLLNDFMTEYHLENQENKPHISCFCPAIVRLIQVKYPSLTNHLIPMKQPVDLSAKYFKKKLTDQGIPSNEIGIFYITPCAAKIAAVKSPVGEDVSIITGVINMDLIYNRILRHLKNNKKDSNQKIIERDHLTAKGITWPLTEGEAKNMQGRTVAIDGIENVAEFLERLENDEITGFDFLELRACDQSCAGGILTSWNRFLTVERLKKRAQLYNSDEKKKAKGKDISNFRGFLHANKAIDTILPRNISILDKDTERAISKMKKVHKTLCNLPGFDCGVCGAPSCQALAEDIAHGDSQISHCLFLQKVMEKNKKLTAEHAYTIIEDIWGENRISKNYNKKGVK